MNEEFECDGIWWLPESPNVKVSGQLEFTPETGASLRLLGALNNAPASRLDGDFNPPLVVGISDKGKEFTLADCRLSQISFNPAFTTSAMKATFAFKGIHFQSPEEIMFRGMSVHYAHLDEWVNKQGFTVDVSEFDKGKVAVKYKRPEPVTVKVEDYEITIGTAGPELSENHNQVNISQKAWVQFSCEQSKPLDDYLSIMHHIRNFLSLAISEPTFPLNVNGKTDANKISVDDGKEIYPPVEIFYPLPQFPARTKKLISQQMLFTLPEVQGELETYIRNWVQKADFLRPVYNLYFSTLYNSRLYLESRFLMLAQAIETYHRRKFDGKYQTDEEYRNGLYQKLVKVVDGVLPSLDNGFKQSLKRGKLWYAHEYSLRKRLLEITEKLSTNLPIGFIGIDRSRDIFVNKVCDTRNYLTHYAPDLQANSAEGVELYNLTEELKTLLEVCLLEELGFSFDSIRRMTFEHTRYKQVFQHWY